MMNFVKFTLPSYTGWDSIDGGFVNCTNGVNLSIGLLYRNEELCRDILICVLDAADLSQQAQFSSAATVLGLLPTALSLMATSTDDLLRIHSRYPILAFFMSLCNPSTISTSITSSPSIIRPIQSTRSVGLRARLKHGMSIPFTKIRFSIRFWQHDLAIHILACLTVVMIVWQTLALGHRGVIVFSCWTSHNPITWVCVAGIVHLLRILTWRLCLGPVSNPTSSSQTKKAKQLNNPRWYWRLSREAAAHLEIRHPRTARLLAIVFQVTGLMNYGYGTLQFSGFTLVAPYFAMRTFTLIGCSALVSRLIAMWLLEVYPDVPVDKGKSDGIEMVTNKIVASRSVDGYARFDVESRS